MEQTIAWRNGHWKVPFFTIWIGQAFSLLGSSLVGFALVWWLTAETGSATILALGTLFQMLPQVVLGPLAGALVDRSNRRWIMIAADSAIALTTLGLVLVFASGAVQIWHVMLLMAIRSAGSAFHWPAMQASTSLMVPEKHLARVAGLNQTLQGAMSIISPPLGALLVMALPMQGVLAIDVATALLAVLPLLFIALPQPERQVRSAAEAATGEKPSMWRDMLEGFRYVRAWPGLLAVILMAVVLNLIFTPVSSLTPLLVTEHFGGGAAELGWIESAFGLGMLGGGLLLSVWGGFKRKIVTSLVALLLLGVGVMLVGFAPAHLLWVAIAGMFINGFTNPIVNGPLMAIVQAHVAPDMQGRVFSLLGSACIAAAPIGLLVIGPLADAIGVRIPFVIAGIVAILMGLSAFLMPAILNIETNRQRLTLETKVVDAPVAEATPPAAGAKSTIG